MALESLYGQGCAFILTTFLQNSILTVAKTCAWYKVKLPTSGKVIR